MSHDSTTSHIKSTFYGDSQETGKGKASFCAYLRRVYPHSIKPPAPFAFCWPMYAVSPKTPIPGFVLHMTSPSMVLRVFGGQSPETPPAASFVADRETLARCAPETLEALFPRVAMTPLCDPLPKIVVANVDGISQHQLGLLAPGPLDAAAMPEDLASLADWFVRVKLPGPFFPDRSEASMGAAQAGNVQQAMRAVHLVSFLRQYLMDETAGDWGPRTDVWLELATRDASGSVIKALADLLCSCMAALQFAAKPYHATAIPKATRELLVRPTQDLLLHVAMVFISGPSPPPPPSTIPPDGVLAQLGAVTAGATREVCVTWCARVVLAANAFFDDVHEGKNRSFVVRHSSNMTSYMAALSRMVISFADATDAADATDVPVPSLESAATCAGALSLASFGYDMVRLGLVIPPAGMELVKAVMGLVKQLAASVSVSDADADPTADPTVRHVKSVVKWLKLSTDEEFALVNDTLHQLVFGANTGRTGPVGFLPCIAETLAMKLALSLPKRVFASLPVPDLAPSTPLGAGDIGTEFKDSGCAAAAVARTMVRILLEVPADPRCESGWSLRLWARAYVRDCMPRWGSLLKNPTEAVPSLLRLLSHLLTTSSGLESTISVLFVVVDAVNLLTSRPGTESTPADVGGFVDLLVQEWPGCGRRALVACAAEIRGGPMFSDAHVALLVDAVFEQTQIDMGVHHHRRPLPTAIVALREWLPHVRDPLVAARIRRVSDAAAKLAPWLRRDYVYMHEAHFRELLALARGDAPGSRRRSCKCTCTVL